RVDQAAVFGAARDRMIVLGGYFYSDVGGYSTNVFTDPWALQFTGLLDAPPAAPPAAHGLEAPAPNPARTRTAFAFALASAQPGSLRIHDAQGRLVRALAEGVLAAGPHSLTWDLRDARGARVAPPLYFSQLRPGPHPPGP